MGFSGLVRRDGSVVLQAMQDGDCLEVGTFCENKDSAAKIRPALDKGTTCSRIPLDGKGRIAVSVTDRRRSNRLPLKEATWTYR